MPYYTEWVVEKRVLYTVFVGAITLEELQSFIDNLRAEARTGTPMVHHISNSLKLTNVEMSLGTLKTVAEAHQITGELGWQVDVNLNKLNRMFASIASQFAKVRMRGVSSVDEAVEFLKRTDPSLRDLDWKIDDLKDTITNAKADPTRPFRDTP